jgi:hypothetical protein
MPVHWTISHGSQTVVAVTKGQVTAADIEKYFAGVTADGAMSYAKIFEITHTPRALSDDSLKTLGQRMLFYAQHGQVGPVAIVAASDESYAQAEIFAQSATLNRPLMIFRESHLARQWLDERKPPDKTADKTAADAAD